MGCNLSVMAVPGLDPGISPGHLDFVKRGAFPIEIAGTRPVTTKEMNFSLAPRAA
jgi:hypothetical protein